MSTPIHIIERKIGKNRGRPRVFLEGEILKDPGFMPGKTYTVKKEETCLRLTLGGSYKVSHKEKSGKILPVIDINSLKLLEGFEEFEKISVIAYNGQIILAPTATERAIRDREARLLSNVKSGRLSVGSLAHGGGVLSSAVHAGLKKAGISAELNFAVEIDDRKMMFSKNSNKIWGKNAAYLAAPMESVATDENYLSVVPKVDIVEMGLPCSGASPAGRSARHLGIPEEHPEVGFLSAPALAILAKANPAIVLLENVPQYAKTASYVILKGQLEKLGYHISEWTFTGSEAGALENRKRWVFMATSKGLGPFDFGAIKLKQCRKTIGSILERISAKDPRWSEMKGQKAKEKRDIAAGKGFRMQVVGRKDTRVGTVTKGYHKRRGCDPKIKHPTNPDLLRQFTPVEHARIKGIPSTFCEQFSEYSDTLLHEILGQSVIWPAFEELAYRLGLGLSAYLKFKSAA